MIGATLRRRLVALFIATLAILAAPLAQAAPPPELTLRLIDPPQQIRVREPLLLEIRGVYPAAMRITLETLEQPELTGFNWLQLGRDDWRRKRIGGWEMQVFTRRMALYPREAARLVIPAFTHRLTVQEGRDRVPRPVVSNTVIARVFGPASPFYTLPARGLTLSESWSAPPEQAGPGDTLIRTVTLVAPGATLEALPPQPAMAAIEATVLAQPETRRMTLTPDGPVSTAIWRWRVRMQGAAPGTVGVVALWWFDVETRSMRLAALRERVVGAVTPAPIRARPWGPPLLVGAAAGFALGAALLLARRRAR